MGDLSKHFSRHEFACSCKCGFDTADHALILLLEGCREHFDRPVHITSGCRCPEYNREVGGSDGSQHLYGRAADVVVEHVPANLVQEYFDNVGASGLGHYDDFTHVDTRNKPARWQG